MAAESLEEWLEVRLDALLGAGSGKDIAGYWLSMDLPDLEQYLHNCYSGQIEVISLFDEIKRRQAVTTDPIRNTPPNNNAPQNCAPTNKQKAHAFIDAQKARSNKKINNVDKTQRDGAGVKWNFDGSTKRSRKQKKRKTNIHGGKLPKARKQCGCQGVSHSHLEYGNCTDCGYIHCIREGFGECFGCGSMVLPEGTISNRSANRQAPASSQDIAAKMKAEGLRDQLLAYQENKAERTLVIDDQEDFWDEDATDMWLSKEERDYAKRRSKAEIEDLHRSRTDRKIKVDLGLGGSGNVREHVDTNPNPLEADRPKNYGGAVGVTHDAEKAAPLGDSTGYFNNTLDGHALEVYQNLKAMMLDAHKRKKTKLSEATEQEVAPSGRLQDGDIYTAEEHTGVNEDKQIESDEEEVWGDNQDKGVCLSMHQPWASLLVHGIKRAEGRSWETKYRGRLWIAAARRVPTQMEIDELESMYCDVYGLSHDEVPFPKNYPTSALLGCVDVVECLSNEEYRAQNDSREENSSSYIFQCKNPRTLFLPGQISGNHKLWRMPQQRLKAVQSGLQKFDLKWRRQSSYYTLKTNTEQDL